MAECVLVECAPGVGKTTFAFELGKRCTRGEVLQDWACMHVLLYYPYPRVRHTIVEQLMIKDGEHVLLVLDGYDELTAKQKQDDS